MKRFIPLLSLAAFALAACGGGGDTLASVKEAEQRAAARAAEAAARTETFVADAGKREGAETLPSGLVIEYVTRGANQSLPTPAPTSTVTVHYEGSLPNGDVFDSSFERGEPASFNLGQVVPGFTESITHMRPGDEIIATFPPELGYGAAGRPPVIPPSSPLQFRIQLLSFRGPDGRVVRAPN